MSGSPSSGSRVAGSSTSEPAAPKATFSGIAGPGCSNSGADAFDGVGYSGDGTDDWTRQSGDDGTGSGCTNGFLAMPMSGSATADGANRGLWMFHIAPVTNGKCTLNVYIPKPPASASWEVGGTAAAYTVWQGTSTTSETTLSTFQINQTANRGGDVVISGLNVDEPMLIVRLYDRGVDYLTSPAAKYGIAAIRATCTQS